ncbi:ComEC/Rec2 family competence protein [Microvirga pakistanensis]|uniref:ComEC/Rec2 family competence protein n=1 Tax=Microvirga pakistanensis TaxID=1682650 RepID=UPI00106A4BE9|nr:ComEC/Rec2 family competence protein [Microvirga pakistanensis]
MTQDNKGEPGPIPRSLARAVALPRPSSLALDWGALGWSDGLRRCLAREIDQRRLFPWLAVCFGSGVLLFFQAERPALWAPLGALVLCAGCAVRVRHNLLALSVCVGLAAAFAGFTAGVVRTRSIAAPVLSRMVIAPVAGFVEAVEDREQGRRVLLRVSSLQGVAEAERPRLVRVSIRNGNALSAGQYIAGTARLLPPPQPAWPGGYDFARDAYYKGIGAVGSFTGAVRQVEPPAPPDWSLRLAARVDEARNALTHRIASSIGGAAGGVGAALVTGKRGLIGEPTNDVLRAAGIYHIVSISGLHMVLAAGTFFWLVRALLALNPGLALLWPVKKIAAVVAMAGATAYCVFSGSDVATERSLVMTLVMFGAVLADRPALSMRNLSVAALVVLAREPEALLGPSFQMSFGAVAAMMALVPLMQWHTTEVAQRTLIEKAFAWTLRSVCAIITTTLVASLATAPFSAYHFQSLNPYGLVGNALTLPLVSLVVMPAAVLGVLAYPFGLDGPIWKLMGLAVAQVLDVSTWVGAFSGSTVTVPALSIGALALLSVGLLVLTIPASHLRWLALVPVGAGLALAATPQRPDIYIDRDGAGAAIRNARGDLTLVGKPSGFVAEQWLRADGDGRSAGDATLRRDTQCDRLGCVVDTGAQRAVAFVQEFAAFAEDCRRAAIVITRLDAPASCGAPVVLDRDALDARGATAIRLGTDVAEIRSVRRGREVVPWAGSTQASASPARDRLHAAQPALDRDWPGEEISSGEPD